MWNSNYNVVMKTPIGPRRGTMEVFVDQGKVDGILDLLKQTNPFSGSIDDDGACQITGQLKTLIRTVSYCAAGQITKEAVRLVMEDGSKTFELTGETAALSDTEEKEE